MHKAGEVLILFLFPSAAPLFCDSNGLPSCKKEATHRVWCACFHAAAREETRGSTLRLHLLEEYAWGHMSPQQMQKIAALAVSDGRKAALADLAELAQAGSNGGHANNVNRDILRAASNMPKAALFRRIAMTVQGLEVSSPADVAANEHALCRVRRLPPSTTTTPPSGRRPCCQAKSATQGFGVELGVWRSSMNTPSREKQRSNDWPGRSGPARR